MSLRKNDRKLFSNQTLTNEEGDKKASEDSKMAAEETAVLRQMMEGGADNPG